MKKHYLHNQNYKNDIDVGDSTNKNLLKTKNVDINILLNRIKLKEKGKKKEMIVLFGVAISIIGITGLFISFSNS
tara:strand:- start:535 stop:759 length:225 start_codon:yes stop_codon:yes gene_type:complete